MDTTTKTHEQVELQDLGNGHWRAVCGDRSFRTDEHDGDLWVDHRELAGFVFSEDSRGPGHIVEHIERSLGKGLILESEAIPVIRDRIDGKPGKKSKSYLLKRNAALIVAAQCALLPSAGSHVVELTRKMADVFEQWLDRRRSTETEAYVSLVAEMRQALAEHREEIRALRAENAEIRKLIAASASSHGLISPDRRRQILDAFQFFADCFYSRKSHRREWSRKRAWFDKETRKACLLPLGMGWDRLPAARDDLTENKLRDLRDTIPEQVRRQRQADRDAAKQMPLGGMN